MAVVVTLMIASRGLRMTGSGTVSTWTFSVPSQQTARMWLLGCRGRSRNLTGFEQLFEAPEILADCLRRFATEERGDERTGLPGRRCILEVDTDCCAAAGAYGRETHRPGGHDVRSRKRPPCDQLVLDLVDDFGVPLNGQSRWPDGYPVRCIVRTL